MTRAKLIGATLAIVAIAAAGLGVAAAPDGGVDADAPWQLRLPDAVEVAPGVAATVSLTVAPAAGWTVSRDGPLRIALASSTLTLPRRRYRRGHAVDPAADAPRFELKLTAPTAGEHALDVDVHAWLCAGKTCRPVHAHRTVAVHAAEPPPPPPPPPPSDDAGVGVAPAADAAPTPSR
ncbi:MAG: hypothetical protein H6709_16720 [Kofleriaceae bacterium]|nr:hypothetical protein [Kofleriaceae bacterium]MCB9573725.1 hypothetical protein [Kofleriaceae bacterium]